MKNRIYINQILISLLLFFSFNISLIAQESDFTWNFPIRPGTLEWQKLETYVAKLNAYNIPQESLKKMSNQTLIDACLSYPEFRLLFTKNSYCEGIDYLITIFNGFYELFVRNDVNKILVEKYKSMNPLNIDENMSLEEKGDFGFRILYLEMLLSHPLNLNNLNKEIEIELLNEAIIKYKSKRALPHIYSVFSLSPTALICARILERNNYVSYFDTTNFNTLTHFGILNDLGFLDALIVKSEEFLKN